MTFVQFDVYPLLYCLIRVDNSFHIALDGFVSMMFVLGGSVSSQVIESSCLTLISHFYSYPENNGP